MITANQLKKFTDLTADQLTEMTINAGYIIIAEPFINICFMGMNPKAFSVDFIYEGTYVNIDENGLEYAKIIVSYDTTTGATSVEYAAQ